MRRLFDVFQNAGAEVEVVHHRFHINRTHNVLVDDKGHPVRAYGQDPVVLDANFQPRDIVVSFSHGVFELEEVSPRGGETEIVVTLNGETYSEIVRCNPKDNYNKRLAIQIGLGRLNKRHSLVNLDR